ncbi:MAG: hypothetical protein KBG48_24075 [Kofleriaceae bacterium]|nr:hypothetical protein [Kofleriaceae bacterium]MBP9170504.1 hypothetical protein [Kofleriaceae bacterium]MBP9860837.1 hypothetical protein [Kofleriaceae bacterium]
MRRARSALSVLPAVYAVGHDLDRDELYVSYDARAGDAKALAPALIDAVRGAGFDPWLKGPGWPSPAPEAVVLPALPAEAPEGPSVPAPR